MRKFKIPKGYTSTNKTIRFPDAVIEQVEENLSEEAEFPKEEKA